ncbi:unnamed protein product [Ceutorhynchus assimilis]|uniref:Uncharacterized protein n=1 Tax=Ceutorhynchus assimilis TaxID=467358 RepID=A0A9N9MXM9_9CUCU|nr:unnamed protein product [Ceutorhynchus assimilis]
MIISRLLGSFYLICFCVSDQRLLIDQLRWDFLELENEIWNMSSNGLLYMTREEAELYLCEKIHDFDRKLMQMPQDLLYGSEAMRGLPKFPSFHSELKMIETLYQKFKDYQQQVMAGRSDRVSLENITYDIKNNKSGAEKTVDGEYEISYEDHNENFYQNFEDYYQQEVMTESPDRMSLEDIIYDIKNNKSGDEKTVDREYEISYEDHNENFYQNFEDYYQQEVMTESPDRMSLEDIIYDIQNNKSGADKTVDREYEISYEDHNETFHQNFEDYYQQEVMTESPDRMRLEDIIYDITNNKSGAEQTIDRAYEIAYKDSNGIQERLDKFDYSCINHLQSPQQPIYNLYNMFALTDLKAYILQQFSHLVNRLRNKGK